MVEVCEIMPWFLNWWGDINGCTLNVPVMFPAVYMGVKSVPEMCSLKHIPKRSSLRPVLETGS